MRELFANETGGDNGDNNDNNNLDVRSASHCLPTRPLNDQNVQGTMSYSSQTGVHKR